MDAQRTPGAILQSSRHIHLWSSSISINKCLQWFWKSLLIYPSWWACTEIPPPNTFDTVSVCYTSVLVTISSLAKKLSERCASSLVLSFLLLLWGWNDKPGVLVSWGSVLATQMLGNLEQHMWITRVHSSVWGCDLSFDWRAWSAKL